MPELRKPSEDDLSEITEPMKSISIIQEPLSSEYLDEYQDIVGFQTT